MDKIQASLLIIGLFIGFTAGVFVGNVSPKQTVPEKHCSATGYTLIQKDLYVDNCGDTVKLEKRKFVER